MFDRRGCSVRFVVPIPGTRSRAVARRSADSHPMGHRLQLVALLLTGALSASMFAPAPLPAQIYTQPQPAPPEPPPSKQPKRPRSNIEWLWQYGPPPAGGRENALIQDPRFLPFLRES